ncbi:hypothetical protein HQ520_07525 [bacterium]|nr:hypothetical protein [bacterium]
MDTYLYMTVFPESLVASMLPPSDFAPYMAVGSRKRTPGRALLFHLDRENLSGIFDLSPAKNLKPHPDGSPKHSVTLSTYRVLERIPLKAFLNLYLVTRDGQYLEIGPQAQLPPAEKHYYLYQELCPMHPMVLSELSPRNFGAFITDPDSPVGVPKILFADLLLGRIADPRSSIPVQYLPYADMGLIRDSLEILEKSERKTLVVNRTHSRDFFYRTVDEGFFLADGKDLVFFPFPTLEERERGHIHEWWRSAELS